jgi:starch phosphorylase
MKERHFEKRLPLTQDQIAYFCMEMGLTSAMPTYNGGLGVLAGDTLKSLADLRVPTVGLSLLYKQGYFEQHVDENGVQTSTAEEWDPHEFLQPLQSTVTVQLEGRTITVGVWEYSLKGYSDFEVPIYFLDTDLEENDPEDRQITDHLYAGDDYHRFKQEAILGIGGIRMLDALGCHNITNYHMNEGHSSLLTVELLNYIYDEDKDMDENLHELRDRCIFTTHTTVPAAHDRFEKSMVESALGEGYIPRRMYEMSADEEERLNMTHLAMNFSRFINGVAKKHRDVSLEMFPQYDIEAITNGIHVNTWVGDHMRELFSYHIPGWENEPSMLRNALRLPRNELWNAHQAQKQQLIEYIREVNGAELNVDTFTIGFGRRMTLYKRPSFIFENLERLLKIHNEIGHMQFVFSGKAHPDEQQSQELIEELYSYMEKLGDRMSVVFLEDYSMEIAHHMISGVDLWLNNPRVPKEASGTSGMKAALNGIPSLSTLDGWWLEGCVEEKTGWGIEPQTETEHESLYNKLEYVIIPKYYQHRDEYQEIMRNAIAINGAYFHTDRMVKEYLVRAYFD